jgi:putative hydrolase of the HAD superfamily
VTAVGAVTFDAMGTLVAIEPPAPRLQRSLARRLGVELDLSRCEAAMRVEMRHYRANCTRAGDLPALASLRLECSSLLADALAIDVSGAELLPSLTDAISFYAFPDAQPALDQLAAAGIKLAVIANWDISLRDVLRRLGLAASFETVVTAAEVGFAKPDPRPFAIALERLGIPAGACVHVGDDPLTDVAGAEGAGITAILIDRDGRGGEALHDLGELLTRLDLAA